MYSYISAIFLYTSLVVNVSQSRESSSVCAVALGNYDSINLFIHSSASLDLENLAAIPNHVIHCISL